MPSRLPSSRRRGVDSRLADRERELLRRVAHRDHAAFETLYRLFHPRLTRYLRRYLRDEAQIEDTIQEVLLAVWRQAPSFRGDSRVSTWVIGIAYHKALDGLRRQASRPIPVPPEEADAVLPGGPGTTAPVEARIAVREALAELPPEQRSVVVLTYFRGLSYKEIGRQLDCAENTVKTRMFHARRKLRRALERLGQEGEEA